MDENRAFQFARLVALIAILAGLFLLVGDLLHPSPTHDRVRFYAPVDIGAHTLALTLRKTPDDTFADVTYGPHTVAGVAPLPVLTTASSGGVFERVAGRFSLYAPRDAEQTWRLIEVDPNATTPGFRFIELPADPPTAVRVERATLEQAEQEMLRLTRGSAPRTVPLVPGPALLLLGAALWFLFGPRPRPPFTPTVALVLVLVAFAATLAWPLMLQIGLRRSLPPGLLGTVVTLLVAAAAGARLQAWAFAHGRAGSAMAGAIAGVGLLGVFVFAVVNINGFIVPIHRPPGTEVSPAGWFMNDFIAPALALGGMGALPAVIGGAVYGLLGRWRRAVS